MLSGYKTYITVAMGLVSVWGAFALGEMVLAQAVTNSLELLGLAAIRAGIAAK